MDDTALSIEKVWSVERLLLGFDLLLQAIACGRAPGPSDVAKA